VASGILKSSDQRGVDPDPFTTTGSGLKILQEFLAIAIPLNFILKK